MATEAGFLVPLLFEKVGEEGGSMLIEEGNLFSIMVLGLGVYGVCVVITKTIVYLSVGEEGGYLPSSKMVNKTSTTIHLHFDE